LRVLLLSKAYVVGIYQRKLEEMARLDSDLHLTLAVPPFWKDRAGILTLERVHTEGYTIKVLPMAFNGRFHLHFYPQLSNLIRNLQPHIVHIDEEPYNLATFHANILARRSGAKTIWFSWQNLERRYPPPFSWFEKYNLKNVNYAITGSQTSSKVWRAKGYAGPLAVIPQLGVDPITFSPAGDAPPSPNPHILYAGRLVPEKGVEILVKALANLNKSWRATILGNGPAENKLKSLVESLGLKDRITFMAHIASTDMPNLYRQTDILVLPSRTTPNWTEQFGRVLVEAMACGVCVIGSDAGEIPDVIGEAGLIFPEGDVKQLSDQLKALIDDAERRQILGVKGRQRILERYTQTHIAQATLKVYKELVS
jgi:glycosyltransferase involved in cell wall biosynthesis